MLYFLRESAEASKAKVHNTASTLHKTARIQHEVDASLRDLRSRLNQITGEIGKVIVVGVLLENF